MEIEERKERVNGRETLVLKGEESKRNASLERILKSCCFLDVLPSSLKYPPMHSDRILGFIDGSASAIKVAGLKTLT